MTLDQLMKLGEPIFKEIDAAIKEGNQDKFSKLLNSPQPKDWIIIKKSKNKKGEFQQNPIELIEAIMFRIFKFYHYDIMDIVSNQFQGKFAMTVSIQLFYDYPFADVFAKRQSGVATVVASSIEMLELATPKAASMAFKNASRKIGKLLGKDLNREIENEDLETIQVDNKPKHDDDFEKFKVDLSNMKTRSEAILFVQASEYKHLISLNPEIKKIIDTKK